jgi:hypothetical protein
MNKIFLFLLLLCFSFSVIADENSTKLEQYNAEYVKILADRQDLLKQYNEAVKEGNLIDDRYRSYKAKRDDLDLQMSSLNNAWKDHQARCIGNSNDQQYVNDCNREANDGEAKQALLNKENNELNKERYSILEDHNQQKSKINEIVASDNADVARINQLHDLAQLILNKINK